MYKEKLMPYRTACPVCHPYAQQSLCPFLYKNRGELALGLDHLESPGHHCCLSSTSRVAKNAG